MLQCLRGYRARLRVWSAMSHGHGELCGVLLLSDGIGVKAQGWIHIGDLGVVAYGALLAKVPIVVGRW